ncbi:hypothetical protein I6U48_13205 [Clostridium sp. PL3]|uniref:Uncharacterized protein n=1 Tax=Clostridium thailandense TaxID=2794346 RepID=A0A949TYD4_9CLOT|nr:hypothetical protein [Clostridium thailandense]MBV7273865.1 hypothetical protein [Clostridium thailandense]
MQRRNLAASLPNIDFMMNMTKEFLSGKIEGITLYNELLDADFKKLIRKQYNYIKKITKEEFY